MATKAIDHSTLNQLVETGAVHAVHIVGMQGGWALMVKYGLVEHPLVAQRSRQIRLFKKLETLVNYLKEMGIVQFDVNAANYSPESHTRPDRAAALKRAHEAAAYDVWFKTQVQASIDDSRPVISHEDAKRQFASRKMALRKEL
ncbi:hypothetical protein PSI15_16930 [Xenorhabdus sp. PR6a]|uniref:antitoxin PaaA2 family protein n=1 Tax=Xenorhabdus sp. PR6a TaxID=3025877 RepID=UPI00235A0C83|nr:hypothetical protein [Xenorhabdus sp. PR6a]MDC9583213.1 hypothetical protein [Xenorhabdus sp. PR6a]